jgi:hypothetical protein
VRKNKQEVVGQILDFDILSGDMAHPGILRLQILGPIVISAHPLARAITEFMTSYQNQYMQEDGRNSVMEMMLRNIIDYATLGGIRKQDFKKHLLESIHLDQNIQEKYSLHLGRKRHG